MTPVPDLQLHLAGSDRSFALRPSESLLAAGLRHGLALPFGCRAASCGVCRARLIQGQVSQLKPGPLAGHECGPDDVLMCRTVPRSDVTLALPQPPQTEPVLQRWMRTTIDAKNQLAPEVLELVLRLPPGGLRYRAGQYIVVCYGERARSPFSIANAPNGETLVLHLRTAPAGRFARLAMEELEAGMTLDIEGPFGGLYLHFHPERRTLMLAGGTGVTPLLAMLEAHQRLLRFADVQLFWGVRQVQDLYLHERLMRWQHEHPGFRYTPVVSEPDSGWTGAVGHPHEALLAQETRLGDADIYVSGPPVMISAARRALGERGVPRERILHDAYDEPRP